MMEVVGRTQHKSRRLYHVIIIKILTAISSCHMSMKDECFDDKSEGKRSVEMLSLFSKENIYFALSWTLLSNK